MDKLIAEAENIELSGADLKAITKQETNILAYHELEKYDSLKEFLGKDNCCIILYETQENRGHYCCVFLRPEDENVVEFFDPYGNPPDSQLKFASYNLKFGNPYLTHFLNKWKNNGGKVVYNDTKLQDWKPHINTCGRWCSTRILLKKQNIETFVDLFTKNRFYRGDFWVSALTYLFTD
jgi:hypothetical protein|tara:strand:- start:887 stop:1423 length:537 start_codon:yes stop_codon:yes gene_type:complete